MSVLGGLLGADLSQDVGLGAEEALQVFQVGIVVSNGLAQQGRGHVAGVVLGDTSHTLLAQILRAAQHEYA